MTGSRRCPAKANLLSNSAYMKHFPKAHLNCQNQLMCLCNTCWCEYALWPPVKRNTFAVIMPPTNHYGCKKLRYMEIDRQWGLHYHWSYFSPYPIWLVPGGPVWTSYKPTSFPLGDSVGGLTPSKTGRRRFLRLRFEIPVASKTRIMLISRLRDNPVKQVARHRADFAEYRWKLVVG